MPLFSTLKYMDMPPKKKGSAGLCRVTTMPYNISYITNENFVDDLIPSVMEHIVDMSDAEVCIHCNFYRLGSLDSCPTCTCSARRSFSFLKISSS